MRIVIKKSFKSPAQTPLNHFFFNFVHFLLLNNRDYEGLKAPTSTLNHVFKVIKKLSKIFTRAPQIINLSFFLYL